VDSAAAGDAVSTNGGRPAADFLLERYGAAGGRSAAVSLYYSVKPLLPRWVQLAMRRLYARRQRGRRFPAWPVEPLLVERQYELIRASLAATACDRLPFVNFWPERKRSCVILTHDVEGAPGVENIDAVLALEQRYGFVSSWNFVAEDYPIPTRLFDRLNDSGCEIGLHAVNHDARLFSGRGEFEQQLPRIHHYLRDWGAVGFRAPSTHRNADWMPELGCRYDSSFPDTDPFEPQAGGCCSIFPYFLGDMVELPITLAQDHTLFEILREGSIRLWERKSDWIIRHHGLINVIVHPDYLVSPERLATYEQLLAFLAGRREELWHALPRQVADWWRARARLSPEALGAAPTTDVGGFSATIASAGIEREEILFELGVAQPLGS
jgi:peptidoglycan/xylan/chitin deacetylase (PgdA/CDA1 family)